MISKLEWPWSPKSAPQPDPAGLEQDLRHLSLRYMRQSVELPLHHEDKAVRAKLYSAARALQEAVREDMVAETIFEIGSNLMGCEQMALLLPDKQHDRVSLVRATGFNQEQLNAIQGSAKRIIEEATPNSIYMRTEAEDGSFLSSLGITACITFRLDSTRKGAVILFDLLPQRNGLDSSDRELLKLLCAYAGPCLAASKLQRQEMLG